MKDKILQIELAMYYEEDEIFQEGLADRVYSISAQICAQIKKIVVEMRAFARELETLISSAQLSAQLRLYLSKVERELKAGHDVYIPDIGKITSVYTRAVGKLRKKVQNIGDEFNKLIGFDSWHVKDYIKNKEELDIEIDAMVNEITDAIKSSAIKVTPTAANGMGKNIINTTKTYISSYVRLIDELDKLLIRFERNTARAEINHDVKIAIADHTSMLTKIKQGSTKMVRKSVFAVCAVTGI